MHNKWSDIAADTCVKHYADLGINSDIALRIYTARLLGNEPKLVLHGGGNVSVKTIATDLLDTMEVLYVKGSGADMATMDINGLPAVRLAPLRRLRPLLALSDEAMVNFQRINLLNAQAPNPSVETLLHAFLPHKYIDHTHATAILAIANQPNVDEVCKAIFNTNMGYVPYIMPGFALAKSAVEIYEQNPEIEGLILFHHGIFTFGDTAQQAYERMIKCVTLAEAYLAHAQTTTTIIATLPDTIAKITEIAPILRGAVATATINGQWQRWIMDFRTDAAIRRYVDDTKLSEYSQRGIATPDHSLRTKNWPLLLPAPMSSQLSQWDETIRIAIAEFVANYRAYFERHHAIAIPKRIMLDPMPRVVLIPGLGLIGVGNSKKAAAVAADIAVATVECIAAAESIGKFTPVSEADMFDMEYWSLEQAKLGKTAERAFARQVVLITGGGSGIGAATALAFAAMGAEVAILDVNLQAAKQVATACGPSAIGIECDVTVPEMVQQAFTTVVLAFGGVDIVISNAGAAWQGQIGTVDDNLLHKSFSLNFFAHQTVASNAVQIMQAQKTGGCLLFNISKQAINPGSNFGPYGLPKAATLALMKQYALEYGHTGIRSNAVNADRIRTGLLTDTMISSRAKARGITETAYMAGNLLEQEVTAEDVAAAFTFLANAYKTTGCTITVDGGNIAASMR